MGEVIAFVSGKGGMGKTALCAAVAAALADDGKKVLCIDCDDTMGDLGHYLGLGQTPALTYADICRGDYSLQQAEVHGSLRNLRFLGAPATAQPVQRENFATLLRQAKQQFDYILLDGPDILLSADQWVLVTQPTQAAIHGARRKADALELQGANKVRLIVNGIHPRDMAALGLTVDDAMDQIGVGLLGIVPRDRAVDLAAKAEKPLHLHTKKGAAAAAARIAQRLQGKQVRIPGRL